MHLAVGTPGNLSLFKIVPLASASNVATPPVASAFHGPEHATQQQPMAPPGPASPTSAHEQAPSAASSSLATQPDPIAQQDDAGGEDAPALRAGRAQGKANGTEAGWWLAAHEAHALPGSPTQLLVSWAMPPEFFQQIWGASEASPQERSARATPHAASPASVDEPPPRGHPEGTVANEDADLSTQLQDSQVQESGLMRLPELPSLRKGAAQSIVPRVNLIAESYACLHVALECGAGSDDQGQSGERETETGRVRCILLKLKAVGIRLLCTLCIQVEKS